VKKGSSLKTDSAVSSAHRILAARAPALLFFNGIGDHLISLPAVRALAEIFGGRLRFICHTDAPELFFSDVPAGGWIRIPGFWKHGGEVAFDADAVAEALGVCDALLSLNRSFTQSVARLMGLTKPKCSVGFCGPFAASLSLRHDIHAAHAAFDLARFLCPDLNISAFAHPPCLPRAAHSAALELRTRLSGNARLVTVHVESGAGKGWPPLSLAEFLRMFLSRHPRHVAMVIGEKDIGIQHLVSEGVVVSGAGLPLAVSLALVSHSDLFIGVDSCMLHVADLFRVPGVGIFGPTRCSEFGFLFSPHRHVSSDFGVTRVSPEAVLHAVESMMAAQG
jgi:ADP-heptose:LPS heptosyltransferase